MKELSAADVSRLTRKVYQLQRANRRLRLDLRAARRLLMTALVRREGDSERIHGFTRRATQYAILLIRAMEESAERKHRYYDGLLEEPRALTGLSMDYVREQLSERLTHFPFDKPQMVSPGSAPPFWRRSWMTLQNWGTRAVHAFQVSRDRLRAWWPSPNIDIFPQRGLALMLRALAVAGAFEQMADECRNRLDFERVRAEIIRGAGVRFDPLMVEALLGAWDEVLAFRDSRRAA